MVEALYSGYVIITQAIVSVVLTVPYLVTVACFYFLSFGVCMFFTFASFVYKIFLFISFIPITYQGLENIPKDSCIVVANHESSLDIFLVGRTLGNRHHTWLAKEELWKNPVLASMLNCFAIPIVFDNPASPIAKQSGVVARAKAKLDEGSTVVLFPEGGRYVDGTIHPFRSGFAVLAYLTGKPVVPVFLVGAGKVLPPGEIFFKRRPLKVIVGKPFVYDKKESIHDFKQRVYAWYCMMNAIHNMDTAGYSIPEEVCAG